MMRTKLRIITAGSIAISALAFFIDTDAYASSDKYESVHATINEYAPHHRPSRTRAGTLLRYDSGRVAVYTQRHTAARIVRRDTFRSGHAPVHHQTRGRYTHPNHQAPHHRRSTQHGAKPQHDRTDHLDRKAHEDGANYHPDHEDHGHSQRLHPRPRYETHRSYSRRVLTPHTTWHHLHRPRYHRSRHPSRYGSRYHHTQRRHCDDRSNVTIYLKF